MISTAEQTTVLPAPSARVFEYELDKAHSRAHFKVRHLMVAFVRGDLGTVAGAVILNESDPSQSMVEAVIDVAGINTGNAERDAHLRSADFLDAARYPAITFVSSSISLRGQGTFTVVGDLTIRGVTRQVTLDVEMSDEIDDPWEGKRRGVTATARINRQDFGVSWNARLDTGGVVVSDTVDVTIEAQLVRA